MHLRLFAAALLVLALALASCGGGPVSMDDRKPAEAFTISVLPESFDYGARAEIGIEVSESDGLVHVDVVASDAGGLKALYFQLAYDRTSLHPVTAEPTEALAPLDELLSLAVLETPEVHFGVAAVLPHSREGFSGTATIARVSFAPGSAESPRSAALTNVHDRSKTTLSVDTVAGELHWYYFNNGDYDQNREVNAADLAPIALHFGKSTGGGPFPIADVESVVDGDGNGEINAADLAPIAGSFLRRVESYNIYASADSDDYPSANDAPSTIAPVAGVLFADAQGTGVRKFYTLGAPDITYDPALYYWVRPADGAHEGTPSNLLPPGGGGGGDPPDILSITADPGEIMAGETSEITVVAVDPEGGPLTYSYQALPGSISGSGSVVTYHAPPFVAAQTQALVVVTVTDEDNNSTVSDVTITVNPSPVTPITEVHVFFAPAALSGSGTQADPYRLDDQVNYTLTAEDQDGNDITSLTAFEVFNSPGNMSPFDDARIEGSSTLVLNSPFAQGFYVVATYVPGAPEELSSDPNTGNDYFAAGPPF